MQSCPSVVIRRCFLAVVGCVGLAACGGSGSSSGSSSGGGSGGSTTTATTIGLSSLAFAPNSVVSGNGSTGTVVAVSPAPTGGVVISLASGNSAAASVPSSVTIPAGSTSTTFSVSSGSVASATGVTITATSVQTLESGAWLFRPAAAGSWNRGLVVRDQRFR